MNPLLQRLLAAHARAYDSAPEHVLRAPGRVNLIGEHTDYNDGFVLPCAIDYQTLVAVGARDDGLLRVVAADYHDATDEFRVDAPIVTRAGVPWANYVRGVVQMLRQRGVALRGGEMTIAGDVPQGAGLSSSASLEVAVLQALNVQQGLDLDANAIALLAQQAENQFVGCQCGIMDQLISARGQAGHALLIDCRSLDAWPVALPADLAVMIIHSQVARGLVDSLYNERRRQCEAASLHFGVPALRDVDLARLASGAAGLDPLVLKRARHVVTENQRTLDAAQAMRSADLAGLGRLMSASHASMRDDFEITVPAIDRLVDITQDALAGEGGARMTGGGFGGCVVALMPQRCVDAVHAVVEARYRSPAGLPPRVWVCRAHDGAGPVQRSA